MIRIGYNDSEKINQINQYVKDFDLKKVYIFSPEKFKLNVGFENIEYKQIIKYKFFYRLLKEIDNNSLIVINECLRTQNRSDLTYNCLRNYLQQTKHQIIFQYFPQIDGFSDFMTLLDFDTRTKFKMQSFDKSMLEGVDIKIKKKNITLKALPVSVSEKTRATYTKKKDILFKNIGLKDPHTIPRNLHLIGGKEKLKTIDPNRKYIGRNNRFKLDCISTYKDSKKDKRIVFEFPHNFINFSDYLYLCQSNDLEVITTDLKVDQWYFERYNQWIKRIKYGYTNLQ